MAAPAVQNLNDVITSLTQANQPLLSNIDQQDQNISNSAVAATQGINAEKDAAFGNITNAANARGATFSGFTPDAQAKYTSATYLPQLAKLQQAIIDSRTALAGQKAGILSNINIQGNAQVQDQRTALQKWQDQQDQTAAEQAFQEKTLKEQQDFQRSQSELDRAATASNQERSLAAAAKKEASSVPTPTQFLASLFSHSDNNGTPLINQSGYTENVIIPQLAANYGLTHDQAATLAYQYRKQYYGN